MWTLPFQGRPCQAGTAPAGDPPAPARTRAPRCMRRRQSWAPSRSQRAGRGCARPAPPAAQRAGTRASVAARGPGRPTPALAPGPSASRPRAAAASAAEAAAAAAAAAAAGVLACAWRCGAAISRSIARRGWLANWLARACAARAPGESGRAMPRCRRRRHGCWHRPTAPSREPSSSGPVRWSVRPLANGQSMCVGARAVGRPGASWRLQAASTSTAEFFQTG
eukprot:364781-Chlamydomonas_euryale.AAC.3